MSRGQGAAVRRVLMAAWLLVSAVGVSTCCMRGPGVASGPEGARKDVCRPQKNIDPKEAMVVGGYVGLDAKVHFTYRFEDGVPDAQKAAFTEAVRRWNDWSDVTRMRLEEGAAGGPIDVTFGKSDLTKHDPKHCAVHEPWSSSVRYNATTMGFAERDHTLAARAYVHEIGHVFGLDHPYDCGLMDERVTKVYSATCEIGVDKTKDISRRDAEGARDCTFAAHSRQPYRLPPE